MPKRKPARRRSSSSYNPYNAYNPTSHAYDYDYYSEPAVVEEPARRKRKGPPKPKPKPKRITKVRFVKTLGAKNQSLSVYFTIIIIFFVGLGAVIAGSNVTIQRNANAALQNQLRELEISNNQLTSQIAQARDIEDIENIARTELGMSEPLAHNIITINLAPPQELIYDFTQLPQYTPTYWERLVVFANNMVNFFVGG